MHQLHFAPIPAKKTMIKLILLFIFLLNAPLIWAYEIKWRAIDVDDQVQVYAGEIEDFNLVAFKGSDVLEYTMEEVINVLADVKHSGQWISSMVAARTIESIGPAERIDYNHQDAPWPFDDRDFVFRITTSISDDQQQIVFNMKSEEHSAMPEQEDIVRGVLLQSYFKLEAVNNGNKTRLEIMMLVDPKGSIPSWLVNLINRYWAADTINSLRNYMDQLPLSQNTLL